MSLIDDTLGFTSDFARDFMDVRLRRSRSRQVLVQALKRRMLQDVEDILPMSFAEWEDMNGSLFWQLHDDRLERLCRDSPTSSYDFVPPERILENINNVPRSRMRTITGPGKFAFKLLPRNSRLQATRSPDRSHILRSKQKDQVGSEVLSTTFEHENRLKARSNLLGAKVILKEKSTPANEKPPVGDHSLSQDGQRYKTCLKLNFFPSPQHELESKNLGKKYDHTTSPNNKAVENGSESRGRRGRIRQAPIPVPVVHLPSKGQVGGGKDKKATLPSSAQPNVERGKSPAMELRVVVPATGLAGVPQPETYRATQQQNQIAHNKSSTTYPTNVNNSFATAELLSLKQTRNQNVSKLSKANVNIKKLKLVEDRIVNSESNKEQGFQKSLARECISRHLKKLPLTNVIHSVNVPVPKAIATLKPDLVPENTDQIPAKKGFCILHSNVMNLEEASTSFLEASPNESQEAIKRTADQKISSERFEEEFSADKITSAVFTASDDKSLKTRLTETNNFKQTNDQYEKTNSVNLNNHCSAQEISSQDPEVKCIKKATHHKGSVSHMASIAEKHTRDKMSTMEVDRLSNHSDFMSDSVTDLDAFSCRMGSHIADSGSDFNRIYRIPSRDELDFEDAITDFYSSLGGTVSNESATSQPLPKKQIDAEELQPSVNEEHTDSILTVVSRNDETKAEAEPTRSDANNFMLEKKQHGAHSHENEGKIFASGDELFDVADTTKSLNTSDINTVERLPRDQELSCKEEKSWQTRAEDVTESVASEEESEENDYISSDENTDSSNESPLKTKPEEKATESSAKIPRFYYPGGKPRCTDEIKATLRKISEAFQQTGKDRLHRRELTPIAKACGYSEYWKVPVFNAAVKGDSDTVTKSDLISMWKRVSSSCHDDASRFVKMMSKGKKTFLEFHDFLPLMQDIVESHPGLVFLREAPEFHSRYMNTVIARIFYTVNRSWSGQITVSELRKGNFLTILSILDDEEDINAVTDFFSYEHFYVIYCKFWELDTDHDLVIDKLDLCRHANGALSSRLIERVLCGAVTRWDSSDHRAHKMSYVDFVWFLMSEEDKKSHTSIEYWFRCMDMDGDGVISMYEMEFFYEEQMRKLEQLDIEPLPFEDCVCQMLDMVKPRSKEFVTLKDLKICKMAHVFFDTFFNVEKYLDHEQKDPFAPQKDVDSTLTEPSDWEKFAAEEYEILVAEEQATEFNALDLSFDDETDPLIEAEFQKLGLNDVVGQNGPVTTIQLQGDGQTRRLT
ncbi:uncharacterized protein LOC143464997 isoform X1 [Clavelina lepadiformis]|uniref:uncharacterized protein LOC143464997 isoform X1 n=1 Tax=Clavelina lepadiformis TaxID=159417 RepID=UPI004041053E